MMYERYCTVYRSVQVFVYNTDERCPACTCVTVSRELTEYVTCMTNKRYYITTRLFS